MGAQLLGPEIRHSSYDLFTWTVRNGMATPLARFDGPMDPYDASEVSDEDMDSIYAWLNNRPNPTGGAALFADYCANCHGADGRGGPSEHVSPYHSAPFTRRRGAAFRTYVRAGHLVDDQGNPVPVSDRGAYMPAISASRVSDAELTQIENWLP